MMKFEGCSYNNVLHHSQLCGELNAIYEAKNHDYGDSFHETFLEEGLAMSRIRLSDKLNRFKKTFPTGYSKRQRSKS